MSIDKRFVLRKDIEKMEQRKKVSEMYQQNLKKGYFDNEPDYSPLDYSGL